MYSQYWQVGLDIQMEAIRALAVIRRRNGWQLRYWWHKILPSGVLREGILHQPDILSEQLKLLRKQLPRHISLRIALPAQRILQHTIHVPDSVCVNPNVMVLLKPVPADYFRLTARLWHWITAAKRLRVANY